MHFKQALPLAFASTIIAQSLTDALNSQNDTLSTLNNLLAQYPEVAKSLAGKTNFTLLAPSNDAFKDLMSDSSSSAQLQESGFVPALLQYHVLTGTRYASNFTSESMFIPTLLTNESYTNVTGGQRVEARARDGTVDFFSGLKEVSSVQKANVNFTGGTIHIVDKVLMIPINDTSTLTDSNLTSLAGAVRAANLEDTLTDKKDITIFAPNNDAFNVIGSVIEGLSTADLTKILGYHVVEGKVAYSNMLSNSTIKATNGDDLKISVAGGKVFVNAAMVTVPDLLTGNGVVHVIDQVLNPSNTTVAPNPTATTAPAAYPNASSGAGVPFTSGVTTPTTTYPAATSATSHPGNKNAAPMLTGAIGTAALFGGAVLLVNL